MTETASCNGFTGLVTHLRLDPKLTLEERDHLLEEVGVPAILIERIRQADSTVRRIMQEGGVLSMRGRLPYKLEILDSDLRSKLQSRVVIEGTYFDLVGGFRQQPGDLKPTNIVVLIREQADQAISYFSYPGVNRILRFTFTGSQEDKPIHLDKALGVIYKEYLAPNNRDFIFPINSMVQTILKDIADSARSDPSKNSH